MRPTAVLALLLAPLAATALSFARGAAANQRPLTAADSIAVPGANPLVHCYEPDADLLKIEQLDLDPNPPHAGVTLHINATGTLEEKVVEGAYVVIQVKVGTIPLIRRTEDICAQAKGAGQECPLGPGPVTFERDIDIPKEVPPARFTVVANAYTKDDRELTCLTGSVDFGAK